MAKSLEELFGMQAQPKKSNQVQVKPLGDIFASPAPAKPSFPTYQMRPAHTPTTQTGPNYGAAWARGTLGSVPGKLLTPLAEKLTGRKIDINTLPESNTFGEKALGMIGHLGADLPLWIGGEMAVAKPLSMLAKTAPVAKGLAMLPKAIKPALNTGVRAGATYGGVVAPAETLVNRDGLQGLIQREKQAPLMALGGTVLHGVGQLAVKGAKTGIDYAKFNKLTKLPDAPKANPLADVQSAYKNPNTLRDAQAQQFNKTFSETSSLMKPIQSKTLQRGVDDAVGVKKPLTGELLKQRELDAQSAFGGPLKTFKVNNETQATIAEITTKLDKQVQDISKMLKQTDREARIANESIRKKVKDMGGIKQSNDSIFEESKVIPNWIRNKNGRPLDEVADTIGMTSDELLNAISNSSYKPKDYVTEAYRIAYKDPEYQALSNTLDTLKSGIGKKPLPAQKSNEPYYHGSPAKFDKFDSEKTGGLINLSQKESTAYKYASGGGGGRKPLSDDAMYLADDFDNIFEKQNGKWVNVGKKTSDDGKPLVINRTKITEKPLNDEQANRLISDGEGYTINKNPNIMKLQANIKNTLDLTSPEGIKVLSQIKSGGDRRVNIIIDGAKRGEFDWGNTKFESSTKVWKNIINPQLEKKGYDSIKFVDDNGFQNYTTAVFRPEQLKPFKSTKNLTDIPVKPRETKQAPIQPVSNSDKLRTLPEKPAPLTWTNRERLAEAGPLPVRSVTPENLNRLPGQKVAPPRTGAVTPQHPQTPLNPLPRTKVASPADDGTIRPQVDRNNKKKRSFSEIIKDIRTQFIDDVAPLEKAERAITGKLASAEESLYKQARLFRGSPEQAANFVRTKFSPIMKSVEKQGKTVEDIGDYALAIHARDVNAKGINSGFSNERIANTIARHGTPEMELARKELMKINNELLDSLAEAGVIEKTLVTTLKQKHPNYMPLFRSFDDEKIEFASGMSKALANVSSPIKKLVGSDRDAIDPVESMIKNIYQSISAVDRNKVALQLGRLADKDTTGMVVRRLAEGEEKSRLNTVFALEGGKKVSYEVQPDVYKAIINLDKESSNMLIKVLQQPASLLRAGATLTPEFSLRNPIRDIPAAYAVSKSGLNPVKDIPMALFDVIRSKLGKDTMYNQFLRDNAGYGNIISTDRKVLQDAMTDVLQESSSKKFVNVISGKSLMRVLRSIADVSESATKLGEYKAALRSGASRPEAAYRARDIMDFARAGVSVREANKVVAFLNANIQGKSKIIRAMKEDPVGVTARAFTSITVPTIGAFIAQKYLANDKQKLIIDDAADWMKATFWLVPIPGTDQVARIPKPFDLAPVFANLPEKSLEYIFNNDKEAFDGFVKKSMASFAIPTMITGLIPFVEGMANYSFFRQGPIIPQRESSLNLSDQYDNRTTETAKFIAKGVNKLTGGEGALKNFGSPRIVDNTIKGLTAGLGTYATSAIDLVAESTGAVDKKNKPKRNVSELPLLRAFLTSDKSGGKAMENLYREKDKLTKEKSSAKLNNDPFDQGQRLARLNAIAGDISDITKRIRNIESDKSISPQSKKDQIDALSQKRNELAKKAIGK